MSDAGYTILPEIYDRWQESYGEDFSSQILPRLLTTLKKLPIPVKSMLDVACGTGTLAIEMHARGWRVIGIDASAGMIDAATRKCLVQDDRISFLRRDMREFSVPDPVYLVTSFFDSINHLLTVRDLRKTFQAIAAALHPGGFFVFDVSNELCYRTLWTQSDTINQKEFTLVLRNRYRPHTRTAVSHVTLLRRLGTRTIRREETVRQRWYSNEEIGEALRLAGFTVLELEDFWFANNPGAGNLKTWWVARRAGAEAGLDSSGKQEGRRKK